MLRSWHAVMVLGAVACGRVDFDPRGDGNTMPVTPDASSSDLLLYFTFESDGLLHDRASGHHDATCTGCPSVTGGATAATSAASFDGTACMHVPAPELKPPSFTFAVWEKRAGGLPQTTLFGKPLNGATGFENSFEIFTMPSSSVIYLVGGDSTIQADVAIGTWHHIAGTYDAGTLQMYVDGSQVDSKSGLIPTMYADDDFLIGCDVDSGSEANRFTGLLDEVRLYDRALNPLEIAALATPM